MMIVKDNNYKWLSPTLAVILTVRARELSVVALEDVVVLWTGHVAAVPGVPAFLCHDHDCNVQCSMRVGFVAYSHCSL